MICIPRKDLPKLFCRHPGVQIIAPKAQRSL